MTSDTVVLQYSTAAPSSFMPFSKGWANRYSKAIRMLGHSYFSHVDFLLETFEFEGKTYTDCLLGASNSPYASVIVGSPRGVAIRPHNYQSFGTRRRMIIQTDRADAILDFAHRQIGKPFDSGALTPKVFLSDPFYGDVEGDERDWRDPRWWFCQEMVTGAFEAAGYWGDGVRLPIKKNRITPADGHMMFLMDPNFINRDTFFDPIPTLQMGAYET